MKDIFILRVSIDIKNQTTEAHISCNKENFDDKSLETIEKCCTDLAQIISIAYIKQVPQFVIKDVGGDA